MLSKNFKIYRVTLGTLSAYAKKPHLFKSSASCQIPFLQIPNRISQIVHTYFSLIFFSPSCLCLLLFNVARSFIKTFAFSSLTFLVSFFDDSKKLCHAQCYKWYPFSTLREIICLMLSVLIILIEQFFFLYFFFISCFVYWKIKTCRYSQIKDLKTQ